MSDFATARQNMVDCQGRPSDVTDIRVIDAMLAVPRENFVPKDRRALAYLDLDLVVSDPSAPKRSLLKPALLARLLQAGEIGAGDNVLVVGCASGYSVAVAARLAKQVVGTEPDAALAASAGASLSALGSGNARVIEAASPEGCAASGPYDVILVEGATEVVPEALYAQLAEGGRLVGVMAVDGVQRAMLVTRSGNDFGSRILFDASAPVLPGFARRPEFAF